MLVMHLQLKFIGSTNTDIQSPAFTNTIHTEKRATHLNLSDFCVFFS